MKPFQKIKVAALAATILALTTGSVMAQDGPGREGKEAMEQAARAVTLRTHAPGPQQVIVRSGRRAMLGVYPDTDQDEETDARGARIRGVVEGAPADEAGLQEGDIIVEVGGRSVLQPLPDPEDEDDLDPDDSLPVQRLVAIARKLDPGDEVEIVYLRDGDRRTTTLTAEPLDMGRIRVGRIGPELEERLRELRERQEGLRGFFRRHDEGNARSFRFFEGGDEPGAFRFHSGVLGRCPGQEGGWAMLTDACVAGIRLVPLNPRLGRYFEADEGVLVADVSPDSSLGLEPGDVILSIDGRQVEDPSDVTRILRSYRDGEELTFRVVRRGDERTVTGSMD